MSNLNNLDIKTRNSQNPPEDKKKKVENKTKPAKLYEKDHQKIRIAAAVHDKQMIEILSESIDLWMKKNNMDKY